MIVLMHELCCAECGIAFAISEDFEMRRRQDGHSFWCPAGHKNHYGDCETDRLRRERDKLKQATARLEDEKREAVERAQKAEKANHNLKRRVGRGNCPCCKRTFANVARHMKTKHPEIAVLPVKSA